MPTFRLLAILDALIRSGLPVLRTTVRIGRATIEIAVRVLSSAAQR